MDNPYLRYSKAKTKLRSQALGWYENGLTIKLYASSRLYTKV